jgi:hypothetical protein
MDHRKDPDLAVFSPARTPDSVIVGWPSPSNTEAAVSDHPIVWLILLTLAVLVVHGYHPFSEDAGIYIAGVRKLANPSLYQTDASFVLANTRLSLFAHLLAAILRTTRMPLSYLLLLTHLVSIFAFLGACWSLARRIFSSPVAQWSAVALAGACFTMPLAATSLMLMDPYVTARSFSTPLGLFALASAIEHCWARTALFLLLTGLMHPLMFIYAAAFVLFFVLVDLGHMRLAWSISLLGIFVCGGIYLATLHSAVSPAYRQAVLSRSYLFPSQWAWFEYLGLAVPLLTFVLALRYLDSRALAGKLCLASVMLGISSTLSAFLFVHPSGPFFLARLQLLRSFHMLYLVGILLLGGLLGNRLIGASRQNQIPSVRWAGFALLAAAAVSMFFMQRLTYPLSPHVELPRAAPRNPWEKAFFWIRANTPPDAVFAANPDLVLLHGEDGQGFRVMTERSLLGDYKDEGVVVVFPLLATQWAIERNAQAGLDRMTDAERVERLQPLGVSWLLLSSSATTSLPCPYHNPVSQVCRLPGVPLAPAQPLLTNAALRHPGPSG